MVHKLSRFREPEPTMQQIVILYKTWLGVLSQYVQCMAMTCTWAHFPPPPHPPTTPQAPLTLMLPMGNSYATYGEGTQGCHATVDSTVSSPISEEVFVDLQSAHPGRWWGCYKVVAIPLAELDISSK